MSPVREQSTRWALKAFSWLGRKPLPRARAMTAWLALPMHWLMRRRAKIIQRNLELCFPQLQPAQRNAIKKQHFRELADSVAEFAFCWHHAEPLDSSIGSVAGLEHLEHARQLNNGIILVTGHTCCLELAARLVMEAVPVAATYRPMRNEALEAYQTQARLRYAKAMLKRDDVRGMIRHLRSGGILWSLMDQDLGPRRSHFVPFFGLPVATAKGLLKLARTGRAQVFPVYPFKHEQGGRIQVEIGPAFESFPSDDPIADLSQYNTFLENAIRRQPAQYWWLHRRFKSTPDGDRPRYQ